MPNENTKKESNKSLNWRFLICFPYDARPLLEHYGKGVNDAKSNNRVFMEALLKVVWVWGVLL